MCPSTVIVRCSRATFVVSVGFLCLLVVDIWGQELQPRGSPAGENFTSYQLHVPGSDKSITIIEANNHDSRAPITAQHVQHLRDRHYQQQKHRPFAEPLHNVTQSDDDNGHGDNNSSNGDNDSSASASEHNYYDQRHTSAKVNHHHSHGIGDDDDDAAAAASRSPLNAQQQRYHSQAISGSDDHRYDRHHHHHDRDVRTSIALNVYDRDDDVGFVQPQHSTDRTFLVKRKVGVGMSSSSSSSSSSPSILQATPHRQHDNDAALNDDDDDVSSKNPNKPNKNAAAYSPLLLQKFIKNYTEKLKLADRKVVKLGDAIEDDDTAAAASSALDRRYDHRDGQIERPSPNPFNDRKGWVTLEAVPWSSSKVSKWHAHVDKYDDIEDGGQESYPQSSSASWHGDRPRPHHNQPAAYHHYDDMSPQDGEYVYNSRPQSTSVRPAIYTTYNPAAGGHHRPTGSASSRPTKYQQQQTPPQSSDAYYDRPTYAHRPPPAQRPPASQSYSGDYFTPPEVEDNFHRDKWYEHNSGGPMSDSQHSMRPSSSSWNEDIITDNRPYSADFPQHSATQRPAQRPTTPHSSGAYNYNQNDRYDSHHPDSGNGEWVLVSKNKGYQLPVRHGQRAMHLQTNHPHAAAAAAPQATGTINDLVSHHSVRLTVLPPLDNQDDTFSSDRRRPQMMLSHGGLLEVESSFDTVDNSVADAFSAAGGAAAKPQTKPKRRIFKGVPLKSRTGNPPDASAVIAAVSAGMVPATMAMMMPIVLGRKRRDLRPRNYWNPSDK